MTTDRLPHGTLHVVEGPTMARKSGLKNTMSDERKELKVRGSVYVRGHDALHTIREIDEWIVRVRPWGGNAEDEYGALEELLDPVEDVWRKAEEGWSAEVLRPTLHRLLGDELDEAAAQGNLSSHLHGGHAMVRFLEYQCGLLSVDIDKTIIHRDAVQKYLYGNDLSIAKGDKVYIPGDDELFVVVDNPRLWRRVRQAWRTGDDEHPTHMTRSLDKAVREETVIAFERALIWERCKRPTLEALLTAADDGTLCCISDAIPHPDPIIRYAILRRLDAEGYIMDMENATIDQERVRAELGRDLVLINPGPEGVPDHLEYERLRGLAQLVERHTRGDCTIEGDDAVSLPEWQWLCSQGFMEMGVLDATEATIHSKRLAEFLQCLHVAYTEGAICFDDDFRQTYIDLGIFDRSADDVLNNECLFLAYKELMPESTVMSWQERDVFEHEYWTARTALDERMRRGLDRPTDVARAIVMLVMAEYRDHGSILEGALTQVEKVRSATSHWDVERRACYDILSRLDQHLAKHSWAKRYDEKTLRACAEQLAWLDRQRGDDAAVVGDWLGGPTVGVRGKMGVC